MNAQIVYDMNKETIAHIQQLNISFWEHKNIAALSQQINSDVSSIVSFCFGTVENAIFNVLKLVLPSILILTINIKIFLLLLVLSLVYIVFYKLLSPLLYDSTYEARQRQIEFYAKMHEQLEHSKFVKIHGLLGVFINRLVEPFMKLYCVTMKFQKIQYLFTGLDTIFWIRKIRAKCKSFVST